MTPDALRAALDHSGAASSDFDLNPDVILPGRRVLRDAAVLVAFQQAPDGLRLLLTKRSSRLRHHPGQIAFPGGKMDAGETPEQAALREAAEEVGLPGADVLGRLPSHETVTGFTVTPVLALIEPFAPVPEPGEVEEVFSVPAAHVLDPARFAVEERRWRGQWRRYYAVPYGPYYIWGATARILRGLADRIGAEQGHDDHR
ncbi:NUDIX hydrolase [Jannaschia formosa]|uniref:NUDIX hydrolase n=1 Tax=Jannaschia formosa TaxID=2259592 RepID=UPI000E1BAEB5|nr:CoA pyrophosphatase [Jannaschia formosa]TFL19394.1 CoA pyrophosphatase [Jannaschia formosa]